MQKLNPRKLEPHFSKWMMRLTEDGLHEKSDIACVLAKYDQVIETIDSLVENEYLLVRSDMDILLAELS